MEAMQPWRHSLRLALCLFTLGAGQSQTLELISTSTQPSPLGLGDSGAVQLTPDGAWAVFLSNADNLVLDDGNSLYLDVFLKSLVTDEIHLVPRNQAGASGGNGNSYFASSSADANYVVFESEANDLVPGDTNNGADIFLWERATGTTRLISRAPDGALANGPSGIPMISADGRLVIFESAGSNLVENDTNESTDLFVFDRELGTIQLVTMNLDGTASAKSPLSTDLLGRHQAVISGDGLFAAFVSSATNLVSTTVNKAQSHVFLRDLSAGITRLVSDGTNFFATAGTELQFAADGKTLVYDAEKTGIGVRTRIFAYDAEMASRFEIPLPTGTFPPSARHGSATVSGDAAYVGYQLNEQIYLWDAGLQANRLVSAGAGGVPGAGPSQAPVLSEDGAHLFFLSAATNLQALPMHNLFQLMKYETAGETISLVSTNSAGLAGLSSEPIYAAISADGQVVALEVHDTDLVSGDDNHAYDLFALTPTGVKVLSAGNPAAGSISGNGASRVTANALSWDGRLLVFSSLANDLVPGDSNQVEDVFIRDLASGVTTRASLGLDGGEADGRSFLPVISGNGRFVAFLSSAENLVTNEANGQLDIFVRDLETGTTEMLANNGVLPANRAPAISADGRVVAYEGTPLNMPPTVYTFDREGGSFFSPGALPNGRMDWTLSADGQLLAHSSLEGLVVRIIASGESETLAAHPASQPLSFSEDGQQLLYYYPAGLGQMNLALHDLGSGEIIRVFTNSFSGVLSPDGRFVAHEETLRDEAFPGGIGLGVFNFTTLTNHLIFPAGEVTDSVALTQPAAFSRDGRWLAFSTRSTNVLAADQNAMSDTYVFDAATREVALVSATFSGSGNGPSIQPAVSRRGDFIVFQSLANDLVEGDKNLASDIFLARIPQTDTDSDGLDDGYELIHFGSFKQAADGDADGDGMSNAAEIMAGTNPADPESALVSGIAHAESGVVLRFAAVRGQRYILQAKASATGEWQDAGQFVAVGGEVEVMIETPEQQRFYRLVLL